MEHAMMCPQCNAPLAPHRFARTVVCSYCGATVQIDDASISTSMFHEAFRAWNSPSSYQFSSWISIKDNHWALDKCIGRGEISDVYTGQRARWPTELVIVKLLRDRQDMSLLDNEWEVLQFLQESNAPGADTFTTLLPQPVMHGDISSGSYSGTRASIFRWASGFLHTFEEVKQAYPQGIPARASIWVWRRILEVLSFIHASGSVHGAVLPCHLLIQENEHGVRLVGYSAAGRAGRELRTLSKGSEAFYPRSTQAGSPLIPQLDLIMSARCMLALLGGDVLTGSLPASVPARLAGIIKRIALAEPASSLKQDAWTIRQELGEIARDVYGPPQFLPIVMPS